MSSMPEVVTHRYHPDIGVCPNLCALPDDEAARVLDELRLTVRPGLKPGYLARRRATEEWLTGAAATLLRRKIDARPGYFFLGDFSHGADWSRPSALVIPLGAIPSDAITFTLGDSMTVAAEADRRVFSLGEIIALFAAGEVAADFGFSDRERFQKRFIEVQVWERSWVAAA